MKHIIYLAVFLVLGCSKATNERKCIDPAQIDPEGVCTKQYDPVCGCNGKTYGNLCEAEKAGLTSWTKGECATDDVE